MNSQGAWASHTLQYEGGALSLVPNGGCGSLKQVKELRPVPRRRGRQELCLDPDIKEDFIQGSGVGRTHVRPLKPSWFPVSKQHIILNLSLSVTLHRGRGLYEPCLCSAA